MKQSVILTEKVGGKVSDGTLHHSTPFICMPMLNFRRGLTICRRNVCMSKECKSQVLIICIIFSCVVIVCKPHTSVIYGKP